MSITSKAGQQPGKDLAVESIYIPVSLLQRMSEAARAVETFQDELEDYLLSQDTTFLAQMRQARAHHLQGGTRPLDTLKQELCIE
ncbi:MAG: hypothetical protein KKA73_14545 [Chloroflexi bacterium]|nr:hypothetical protein [Chloroflexota bacterium]MBU1748905.1 hypothetical protein [Chloroflexota bacterium]